MFHLLKFIVQIGENEVSPDRKVHVALVNLVWL